MLVAVAVGVAEGSGVAVGVAEGSRVAVGAAVAVKVTDGIGMAIFVGVAVTVMGEIDVGTADGTTSPPAAAADSGSTSTTGATGVARVVVVLVSLAVACRVAVAEGCGVTVSVLVGAAEGSDVAVFVPVVVTGGRGVTVSVLAVVATGEGVSVGGTATIACAGAATATTTGAAVARGRPLASRDRSPIPYNPGARTSSANDHRPTASTWARPTGCPSTTISMIVPGWAVPESSTRPVTNGRLEEYRRQLRRPHDARWHRDLECDGLGRGYLLAGHVQQDQRQRVLALGRELYALGPAARRVDGHAARMGAIHQHPDDVARCARAC